MPHMARERGNAVSPCHVTAKGFRLVKVRRRDLKNAHSSSETDLRMIVANPEWVCYGNPSLNRTDLV